MAQTKKINFFTRIDVLILGIILVVALGLRVYKINIPLADWHSWRQADTAAVARNFVKDGFDVLHPRYDDVSNIQSGFYNPKGYRFVEFPLYNSIIAGFTKYLPVLPLEIYGRIISILFSLIVMSVIYYLALKEESRIAAFFSATIFATFPFFVYYSRVILPEMTALSFIMLSIFFLYLWQNRPNKRSQWIFYSLSLIFSALSLLVKPTAGFYFLSLLYIFFNRYKFGIIKKFQVYIYFLLALIPIILWRNWIGHFPEGIPAYEWLLNTVNTTEGPQIIFFRPAFFRWIFHERILLLILGGYAALFTVLGALNKPRKSYLFYSLMTSALIYVFTFQGGNVQHDYYQVLILPPLALFSGVGISYLLVRRKTFTHVFLNGAVILAILGLSFMISFQTIKGYYNIDANKVSIAKVISTITPNDALIVTDTTGDTTLLYLANRKGFPAVTDKLENLKAERGAEYFVTTNGEVALEVQNTYDLIFENDSVFIFKL